MTNINFCHQSNHCPFQSFWWWHQNSVLFSCLLLWPKTVIGTEGKILLEKEMAIHSSTIAWKIPWTEEPGRLQPMGSQRVGLDWATSLSLSLSWPKMVGGKNSTVNPSDNTGLNCSKQRAVLSCVWLFVTPWMEPTRLLCLWSSPGKNTGGGCHSSSSRSFQPRDQTLVTWVSCIDRQILYRCTTWKAQIWTAGVH